MKTVSRLRGAFFAACGFVWLVAVDGCTFDSSKLRWQTENSGMDSAADRAGGGPVDVSGKDVGPSGHDAGDVAKDASAILTDAAFVDSSTDLLRGSADLSPQTDLSPPSDATIGSPGAACYKCSASNSCVPAPGTVTCGSQDSLCGLVVNDPANAGQWSFQPNLQFGNQALGTDSYNFTSAVSAEVAGSAWIRPSGLSKSATSNPLVTFTIGAPADVYVGLDSHLSPPSWLAGWTATGKTIAFSAGSSSSAVTQNLWKARFPAGAVALGPLGCAASDVNCSMYITAIKFVDQPTGSGGEGLACVQTPPVCTPAIASTGGIPCPGQICAVGAYRGNLATAADTAGSHVCVAPDSFCANGSSTGTWGVAVGVNLYTSATPVPVQLTGTGLTFQLSSLPPQGMRAQVTIGYNSFYYAPITSASQTIAWTSFSDGATHLTGAPTATQIVFVVKGSTGSTFDFCVTSLSFPGSETCQTGYHDGGNGTCVQTGTCSTGYHDGGNGTCVATGTCSTGYNNCSGTCSSSSCVLSLGSRCSSGSQCASTYCTDGVCCGSASCANACATCSGSLNGVPNGQCGARCMVCNCTAGNCTC